MLIRILFGAMFGLLLSACSTVPATAPTSDPTVDKDFAVDHVKRKFELTPAVTEVKINNAWGDVHLKSMDAGSIGIYAIVQRIGKGAVAPEFDFHIEGKTARLEVRYAAALPPETSGRVDLAVYLPTLADVDVTTDGGLIRGLELSANLTATSRTGTILASSEGRLQLKTHAGDIRATQISGEWSGDMSVVSGTGHVALLIPPDSNARLDVRGGGGVSEDFGATMQVLERSRSRLLGELGASRSKQLVTVQSQGEVIVRPFYSLE
ncbi:MAG: hypothetical protein WBP11_05985 [Dokdonella sp.]